MLEIPEDRSERRRLFKAIDGAFNAGDIEALKTALGNSPRWFDEPMPHEFGLGHPLECHLLEPARLHRDPDRARLQRELRG